MTWRTILLVGAVALISSVVTTIVRDALEDEELAEDARGATVDSAVLNETREYTVQLPESYSPDGARRYPVLYVLDGQSQAGHTAESAALMARIGAMPEVIIVGVSSMGGDARNRDYTPPDMRLDTDKTGGEMGSGDRFLAFLRDELIPVVEHEYPTTRPRMLTGWSRGGLFVTFSLLAAPALFDARFAHSPALWRENDLIVTQLDSFLASGGSDDGFLFLSLGEKENEKMRAAFAHAIAMLERRTSGNLRWRSAMTRNGGHETNARLATPIGLCGFFVGGSEPGAPSCPGATIK